MATELKQGNCLELMKSIESNSIDMILCDLPYGLTHNPNDKRIPFKPLWEQYKRIIKDNGCIALFSQGKFYVDLVESNKKMFRYDLVWDKKLTSGFLNANRMPLRQHEQIAIFYKKLPTYNPIMTIGQPLHSKGHSYKHKEFKNQNYGKFNITDDSRVGSVLKYPTSIIKVSKSHPSVSKHRTEKPTELLEYLIKTYTNKGDTILDNCMGCGSTGIASVRCGRNFIGYEIDETYFNLAKQLIEQEHNYED